MRVITEKRLIEIKQEWLEKYGISASVTIDALIEESKELNPWKPITESVVDGKQYLFLTKSKLQRVDGFHYSQHPTKNTDLRWQEKPGDRYTHFQELPDAP